MIVAVLITAIFIAEIMVSLALRDGVTRKEGMSLFHRSAPRVVRLLQKTSLDNLSLRINDEAVLLAQDSTFGAALEARFLADIAKANEVTLEQFNRRPLFEKLTHWVAVAVRNFM